jgi:hypothetical protein
LQAEPAEPLRQDVELARRLVVLDQQHLPLPLHLREGGRPVVLREGVVYPGPIGNELGLVGVEVRGADLLPGREDLLAGREHHRPLAEHQRLTVDDLRKDQLSAHFARIAVRRLRGVVEHDLQLEGLAAAHVVGDAQPLHRHLRPVAIADGHRVDADAGGGQPLRLLRRVAEVLVPVADDHDALGGILGKRRLGELDRGGQVGVVLAERAFDFRRHLHVVVERRDLDGRLAPEDDHAHLVRLPAMRLDLRINVADHGPAGSLGDAQRLVEQINDRQPVAGAHHLDFGQRQHQQREHEAPQRQDHQPPQRAQKPQDAETPPPQHRQQGQQQQPPGRGESDLVIEHDASGQWIVGSG